MEELEAAIAKMNPGKLNFGRNEILTIHGLLANYPKSETFHRHSNFEKPNKNASECKTYRPISPHQHPLQAHGTGYPP
ncbi:hypothetical protein TNCV_3061121 [Trichonephila clavipes]|nr:hypothetical protein TNCV_3061121 [Trichonephila clavipes]